MLPRCAVRDVRDHVKGASTSAGPQTEPPWSTSSGDPTGSSADHPGVLLIRPVSSAHEGRSRRLKTTVDSRGERADTAGGDRISIPSAAPSSTPPPSITTRRTPHLIASTMDWSSDLVHHRSRPTPVDHRSRAVRGALDAIARARTSSVWRDQRHRRCTIFLVLTGKVLVPPSSTRCGRTARPGEPPRWAASRARAPRELRCARLGAGPAPRAGGIRPPGLICAHRAGHEPGAVQRQRHHAGVNSCSKGSSGGRAPGRSGHRDR